MNSVRSVLFQLNKLIKLNEVLAVWLDEVNDFGIVELEDSVLGSAYCPIERNETYEKEKYSIIDFHGFPNYQGARRNIKPFVTGKLSKRNIDILGK